MGIHRSPTLILGSSSLRERIYACFAVSGSAFLDFRLNGLRIFFFHLVQHGWFAGYRCFGDISLIKALIEAQIAGGSRLLTIFPQKHPDQMFKQLAVGPNRIVAST